ncbi:uncharacterized protein [Eleutherodactylus coqui]
MKDPDRLSKWVMAIRRKNWKPSASSRICSDHFTEKDYMLRPGAMVPRLRLDAVPSVFDGFPNHLKERLEKKKTFSKKICEQVVVIGRQRGTRHALQPPSEPKDTNASRQNSKRNVIPPQNFSPLIIKQETNGGQDEKNEVDKMKTCAVRGCSNTDYEGSQQLFFRFPWKDPELLSKWLVATHCENCPTSSSGSICSDHFTEKDYIFYPGAAGPQLGPGAVPSLFIALPTEIQAVGDSPSTRQVTHGCLARRAAVTCAVHGCKSVFGKGCGKRFYRFPMKNPERLSKWLKALQCSDWKLSASSRICSDHFRDKDYILRPGILVPRLHPRAVPSVFRARRSRRKQIIATDQKLGHSRSMEVVAGFQETETPRPRDHTYSAAHDDVDLLRSNPDATKLKKKVRTLQRQIQRQRHTIIRLSERLEQLKNNSAQLHQQ